MSNNMIYFIFLSIILHCKHFNSFYINFGVTAATEKQIENVIIEFGNDEKSIP